MSNRLIIEQFDPWRPKPGGIDTCIRGLIKYAPATAEIKVAGVDAIGDKVVGTWVKAEIEGREFDFMPLAKLDHADLKRVVPHSVRLAIGLLRHRPHRSATIAQTHRINMGLVAKLVYPRASLVQLIHSSGVANLRRGSKSFFRWLPASYRAIEWIDIRLATRVFIFSKDGAERLGRNRRNVHFSPTWYDSDRFYPAPEETRKSAPGGTRILWACRVEPAKDPALAIESFATLGESYRLTVAGGGTLLQAMRDRAQELGVSERVDFIGAVDKAQMGDLMRDHDLLLMSSVFEGFSRSIVEALASGLPVVTTPGGEPNGLVVSGFNGGRFTCASDFAEAVAVAEGVDRANCATSVQELRADLVVSRILNEEELR